MSVMLRLARDGVGLTIGLEEHRRRGTQITLYRNPQVADRSLQRDRAVGEQVAAGLFDIRYRQRTAARLNEIDQEKTARAAMGCL